MRLVGRWGDAVLNGACIAFGCVLVSVGCSVIGLENDLRRRLWSINGEYHSEGIFLFPPEESKTYISGKVFLVVNVGSEC